MQNVGAPRPMTLPTRQPVAVARPVEAAQPAARPQPVRPIQAQGAFSEGLHPLVKGVAVVAGAAGGGAAGVTIGAYGSMLVAGLLGLGEGYMALGMLAIGFWGVAGLVAGGWAVNKLLKKV